VIPKHLAWIVNISQQVHLFETRLLTGGQMGIIGRFPLIEFGNSMAYEKKSHDLAFPDGKSVTRSLFDNRISFESMRRVPVASFGKQFAARGLP
jgi:hypothetical protein